MKKIAQEMETSSTSRPSRGRKSGALILLFVFLAGFGLMASLVRQGYAQAIWTPPFPPQPATPAVSGETTCTCNMHTEWYTCDSGMCSRCVADAPVDTSCVGSGTSNGLATMLSTNLATYLTNAKNALRGFIDNADKIMTENMLTMLEYDFIKWWQTMWYYNLKPGLQNMTDQINVSYSGQSLALHSALDATATNEDILSLQKHGLEDLRNLRPSGNTCVAATESGGLSRATMFARAMRKAWQTESLVSGLNTRGMNVISAAQTEARRYADYKAIFCDPDANGGYPGPCTAADPVYYNADVQITKFIYDKLTIGMDPATDPTGNMAKTVETINNNLVGVPSADTITPGAIGSTSGQAIFLDRRSYLARYGAVRSVPQLITGWRVPGGGNDPLTGKWVEELREAGGFPPAVLAPNPLAPLSPIATNPSYKEIMHAMTVDRFNSGRYAAGLITNESALEMEKLTLDALYLMQLRDYYELLERTALTLAVQVSIMSDEIALPSAVAVVPF